MSDTRPGAAQRLQAAREAAGFASAAEAATRFGWAYDTYAQHENGTRGITRAADRYAKAFKVGAGWLLTGEGEGPGAYAETLAEIVRIFRRLPPELQTQLLDQAKTADAAAAFLAQTERSS